MNIEKWEQTRVKGKSHFIWVKGFLSWGFMTAALWSIMMHYYQPYVASKECANSYPKYNKPIKQD